MMNSKTTFFFMLLLSAILTGCDNKQTLSVDNLPEVNEENCKPEALDKIKPKAVQQEMASRCVRQSRFKKSNAAPLTF